MLRTARPTVSARDVFVACCSTIADLSRKDRLSMNVENVETASAAYANAGTDGNLSAFPIAAYRPIGMATSADFEWLYEARMVKSKPGRRYYELLRDANDERCALCNVRPATTLDHHLPKSTFAVLVVTPDNLIPACDTCNHTKLDSTAPTLNTYFDDLGSDSWLKARIIEGNPYVPEYFVDPLPVWPPELATRAQKHFELFGLQKLYAAQANRYLAGIRLILTGLHKRIGKGAVREHLQQSAISYAAAEPNGWETAICLAAASSDWFCDKGFTY
ncbi:HNH endonuclease [Nocardia niwae]|uniref:HNH endonuclease signature motif containing protein n=1 Tax=Nocardia niwae TaxID=626084 RepID=A0ABV2X5C4_9NOCA